MDERQSDELISVLKAAVRPFQKYMRDLRRQSWLKTLLVFILLVEAVFVLGSINKVLNRESKDPLGILVKQNIKFDYLEADMTTDDLIAVVPISGIISEEGGDITEEVKLKLRSARKDPRIKAVILKVQSPGGTVNASNLIWNEIVKFKKSGKPVVAFFNGLAASGGYYISAPADKIIATPETWTGSIGVIMQIPNFSELLKKVGVKFTTIKSGPRKDMLSPYKPSEEKDRKIAQNIVDGAFNRFVKKVAEGRKMTEADVRVLADGRIYDAEQAFDNGLIDQVGYIEDAFNEAKSLAKLKNASLVQYKKRRDFFGEFFAMMGRKPLINIEKPLSIESPGLYYLWIGDK